MKIDLNELVSVKEAAEIRGVSVQAISRLMERGRLPVIEVSGKKFTLRKEVEAFKPNITGRPRKDAAAKASQASKTTKSAKKKRSS